jgi:hypothetical protein
MRQFEITFSRNGRYVSRALFQGLTVGQARGFARALMSTRDADRFAVEEL